MFPAGLIISMIAMAAGIGGAVFFSPLFFLVLKLEPQVAFAIGLLIEIVGFESGAIGYARQKLIEYRCAKLALKASIPAAIAGVFIADFIPPIVLLAIFGGGMLLLAVVFLLPEKKLLPKDPSLHEPHHHRIWDFHWEKIDFPFYGLSAIGGLFLGMVSAGLGETNEYNIEKRLNMPPARASGTSVFIVIITALAASVIHIAEFVIHSNYGIFEDVIAIIIFAGPGSIIGAQLGVKGSKYLSHNKKKILLAIIFFIISILTFLRVISG